jgi:hypothetical protein
MKYLAALILGIASGVLTGLALLYFNPLSSADVVTPLMVSDRRQFILNFSAVPAENILFTNNGESRIKPSPQKVTQLWEAPLRDTEILVAPLFDYRGQAVGAGIKFASLSEETRLLNSEAIVDSTWHIILPGQGTLLVAQRENRWDFIRQIVIPARWTSANGWRGTWRGLLSAGPNALGTARVFGGSGRFDGAALEAVEYLRATAYSRESGPVAADGQLVIEFQDTATRVASDSENN